MKKLERVPTQMRILNGGNFILTDFQIENYVLDVRAIRLDIL